MASIDDFMIRKVLGSQELTRTAGMVTTKLAAWLGDRGGLHAAAVEATAERGKDAARDLPRVEPKALWLEGDIGPLAVPAGVSAVAQVGWIVNAVPVRTGGSWHLVEVGNVYP